MQDNLGQCGVGCGCRLALTMPCVKPIFYLSDDDMITTGLMHTVVPSLVLINSLPISVCNRDLVVSIIDSSKVELV